MIETAATNPAPVGGPGSGVVSDAMGARPAPDTHLRRGGVGRVLRRHPHNGRRIRDRDDQDLIVDSLRTFYDLTADWEIVRAAEARAASQDAR